MRSIYQRVNMSGKFDNGIRRRKQYRATLGPATRRVIRLLIRLPKHIVPAPVRRSERSTLASDEKSRTPHNEDYILTYWGPDFLAEHALNYPEISIPPVSLDIGTLGIDYLLQNCGAAYFPRRSVQSLINDKLLFEVGGAPKFKYPAYAMFSDALEARLSNTITSGLHLFALDLEK